MNDIQYIILLTLNIFSGIYVIKSFFQSPIIKKLIIYPIKSLPGFEVDYLEIFKSSVKWNYFFDRSLALLSEKNTLITQRNFPQLSLIKIHLNDDEIILNAPDMETLKFSYNSYCSDNLITFQIWGQETQGYDCGEKVGNWFSKYLNAKIKMVKFVNGLKQCKAKELNTGAMYQDQNLPLLVINQESVDDLNLKLNGQFFVSYRNFRPNILIEHAGAYEEDRWKTILINGMKYDYIRPSDRCMVPCVDPDIGKKSINEEPLKILKTYRIDEKWSKISPLFGVHFVPRDNTKIYRQNYLEIIEKQI